jgi:hypothetical protein
MVKAISNNQDTERFDLKTLEGGFIVARRLSYGEKLQRRAMVSNFRVRPGDKKKDFEGEMNFVNEQATLFDFQHCIVDHNLDKDDDGTKLNFANLNDIRLLDPRVGEEIDSLLDKLNNFDDEDESGN